MGGYGVKEVGAQVERKEAEEREGKGGEEEGGNIEGVDLDEEQRPTGLFKEDSMRMVEVAVSKPSFETRYAESMVRGKYVVLNASVFF